MRVHTVVASDASADSYELDASSMNIGFHATWRLLCSAFLVITCFRIRDYDIQPQEGVMLGSPGVTILWSCEHRDVLEGS